MQDTNTGEKKQEDKSTGNKTVNKFQKAIKRILKMLWGLLLLPFQLLIHFAHLLNEVRLLILSLLTIFVVFCVALILIMVFKPDFAWIPLKDFLNDGVKIEQPTIPSAEDIIYQKINDQVNKPGEVKLTDAELTILFRKSGLLNGDSIVMIKKDMLKFYSNIDTKDKPLWLIVTAEKQQDGNLRIAEVGFQKFNMPGFIANMANSSFSSITDLLAKQNGKDSTVILFNQLIDARMVNNILQLKQVELTDGYAILTYSVIIK